MDRRLLFPAVAMTAWAQQPAPATADVEAALRARVEQFYQLQVDKKFRQSEVLIAEDSKDAYYNGAKPDIKGFSIQSIELLDNATRARVTLKAKINVKIPVGAQEFEMPGTTAWKIENGEWMWYIDKELTSRSPFGKIESRGETPKGPDVHAAPVMDVATLMSQVTIDGTKVLLNSAIRVQTLTVSNNLPGQIHLEVEGSKVEGLAVELEKPELKSGEKSAIRFQWDEEAKISRVVRILVSPINKVFEIQVNSN